MQNISLKKVNAVLYLTILTLGIYYGKEILWSAANFKDWMKGNIDSPVDEELSDKAKDLIAEKKYSKETLKILNQALEINPVCEARFLLGEYYFNAGEYDKALAQYEKYLIIDPSSFESYLRIAEANQKINRPEESAKIIKKGLSYFRSEAPKFVPTAGRDVRWEYTAKATERHHQYLKAIEVLSSFNDLSDREASQKPAAQKVQH